MAHGAKNVYAITIDGYMKLWAAVLEQAMDDIAPKKINNTTKRIRLDAINWFKSINKGIGTFSWICEILDLDAQYILAGIKRHMKDAQF